MTETFAEERFAEQLTELLAPIDSVQSHPENPRQGVKEKIAESLARFGQTKPILVQKSTGYIAAGNHTHGAAVALGWTRIARVEMDWDDETTRAYLVADNRLSDLATNDDAALASILETLMLSGQLQGTGYSAEDVDDLMSDLDALPTVDAEFKGEYRESAEDTAGRYREPGAVVAMRQFILMVPEGPVAEEIESNVRHLKKKWGISDIRGVVAEALRRCVEVDSVGEAEDIPSESGGLQDVGASVDGN